MPTIIESNVVTGERTEREITAEEIAAIVQISVCIPKSVAALQGLLAIDHFGLSSAYEAWANDPSRTFVQRAFINKALTWKRDDQTLNAAALELGLTSTQLDNLFALAATL